MISNTHLKNCMRKYDQNIQQHKPLINRNVQNQKCISVNKAKRKERKCTRKTKLFPLISNTFTTILKPYS